MLRAGYVCMMDSDWMTKICYIFFVVDLTKRRFFFGEFGGFSFFFLLHLTYLTFFTSFGVAASWMALWSYIVGGGLIQL
jgi:hypothetical protein